MTIRFVIDERSIDLNGLSASDGLEVIEQILDRIEEVQEDGHSVCFDDELFHVALVGKRSFWDLCDPKSPISLPREVSERATAIFGTMLRWHEVNSSPPLAFDVSIDGGPVETTASVAWAHKQAVAGGLVSVACICASGKRRTGAVAVEVSGRIKEVWFVQSTRDVESYFRWLIAQHATTHDEIAELSASAFRQLVFAEKCFDGIRTMSKPCRMLAPSIVHYLSALSDEGPRIFSGPWSRVPAEFGALGVEISDENGNTKSNARAKRERKLTVGGEELIFWWHAKIERHQDRIHFYPNKVSTGGKIIVGIFCLHLTV